MADTKATPAAAAVSPAPAAKLFKCKLCQRGLPKPNYSGKQLKNKGKRICKLCCERKVAYLDSQAAGQDLQTGKVPKAFDHKAEGNQAVKHASAAELAEAQKMVKKGEKLWSPEDDKYDTMLKWLLAGGAKFPHLLLKYYTVDYRGVHSKARLSPGECILEVPLKLLMTTEVAKESQIGKLLASRLDFNRMGVSSHTWLASFLMQEKRIPDSFWKPYLDVLPTHYRNMPIFFDDEELRWLKGSFTQQMISDRKVSLKMEYDTICRHVPEYKAYHHLEFFWARLAVITRIFGFEVNGHKTDGLVPMADMLNHKRPNETTWCYDQGRGGFTITTTKRLLKGAQIFDSYGRKCNSRYFVNYGFSLDTNEDNQVALWFELPKTDPAPVHRAKAELIGARQRRFQIPFDHREKVTVDALAWLRVAYASEEELKTILTQATESKFDPKKVGPISIENENRVMQALAAQAAHIYAQFDTTLEEDNKLLLDPEKKLTMNIRNCIIMRRGEKEVLQAYISLGKNLMEMYDQEWVSFRRMWSARFKNRGLEPDFPWRTDKWITDIFVPFFTGERQELQVTNNSHQGD